MKTIFFTTDRFNLSQEQEYFINPCCFGEDLANWLKPKLEEKGVQVLDIYQEDWGWEIECLENEQGYYLGVGGWSDEDGSDMGQWRIMFTKRRTLLDGILGRNKLSNEERIIQKTKQILEEAGFSGIDFDEKF